MWEKVHGVKGRHKKGGGWCRREEKSGRFGARREEAEKEADTGRGVFSAAFAWI